MKWHSENVLEFERHFPFHLSIMKESITTPNRNRSTNSCLQLMKLQTPWTNTNFSCLLSEYFCFKSRSGRRRRTTQRDLRSVPARHSWWLTLQAMYVQRNIEAGSCNHRCGKAVSIMYSECVFVALWYATCNAHTPYCHLWPDSLYKQYFFHIFS